MRQSYSETLQSLFNTFQLYGYVFEKTFLTSSKVNSLFNKTIIYVDDDDNSDYYGDTLTSNIRINVELDINEFSENVDEVNINLKKAQKIIDELRKPSDLPNVNVPKRVSDEIYDDAQNVKKELQNMLRILDLHCDYVNTVLTHNRGKVVFRCGKPKIFVNIEFVPDEIVDEEFFNDEDDDDEKKMLEVVDRLLNAPAARGKRKDQKSKKTKRKKQKSKKTKKLKRRQSQRK